MSPEGTNHRLAAILFTDVVGYTAPMAEFPTATDAVQAGAVVSR